MKNEVAKISRGKFVKWMGVASAFAAIGLRFMPGKKKQAEAKKFKFLTQDGQLVEIDEKLLSGIKRNVTDQELQSWVKK